jgi:hypothetical protein
MMILSALLVVILVQLLAFSSSQRIAPAIADEQSPSGQSAEKNISPEALIPTSAPGVSAFSINVENSFVVVDGVNRFIKFYQVEWNGEVPKIVEKASSKF